MKKLAAVLFITTSVMAGHAQVQINFFNTAMTLVSTGGEPIVGPVGSYYFGLLTAPQGTVDRTQFSFSIYATNMAVPGRIFGGLGVPVEAWEPGERRAVFVAGWSADLGHDYNPLWLTGVFPGAEGDSVFGVSMIAPSYMGGGSPEIPPMTLFGGGGIEIGFDLIVVPEPGGVALCATAAMVCFGFRRFRA